jgi:hypothetical protein
MRTDFETVAVERHDDDILLVTLNRPDAANALKRKWGSTSWSCSRDFPSISKSFASSF